MAKGTIMNLHDKGKLRRKRRILDAVIEIVDKEGVGNLTISRVAELAEVSVKTIYNLTGSLNDILDELVITLFESLQHQGHFSDTAPHPEKVFDEFIDANCLFLASNEKKHRAAIKAILHINISHGRSYLSASITRNQLELFAQGIQIFSNNDFIKPAANIELLADQMIYAHGMLLESWAANVIDLERFRLTCKYHIWTLLRAWAHDSFIYYADETIMGLQNSIVSLNNNRRRNSNTHLAGSAS